MPSAAHGHLMRRHQKRDRHHGNRACFRGRCRLPTIVLSVRAGWSHLYRFGFSCTGKNSAINRPRSENPTWPVTSLLPDRSDAFPLKGGQPSNHPSHGLRQADNLFAAWPLMGGIVGFRGA